MSPRLVWSRTHQASGNRQFDGDDAKSTLVPVAGRGRTAGSATGGYGVWEAPAHIHVGTGRDDPLVGRRGDAFRSPDRRTFFGSCLVRPCPGGATVPFGTTVNLIAGRYSGPGPTGRLFFTALYNGGCGSSVVFCGWANRPGRVLGHTMANAGELPVSPQREVLGRWADFESQAGSCSARWSPLTVSKHCTFVCWGSPRPSRSRGHARGRTGRCRRWRAGGSDAVHPLSRCVRRQRHGRKGGAAIPVMAPAAKGVNGRARSPTANGVAMVACLYRRHRGASPAEEGCRTDATQGRGQLNAAQIDARPLRVFPRTVACVARGDAGVTVCPSGHRDLFQPQGAVMKVDSAVCARV